MRRYNDYELLYMFKGENCELALNILINKYKPLIYKIIYKYGTSTMYVDDFFQEGTIVLYETALDFDESYNKTFTRYFELILSRKVINLKRQLPKYELHENFSVYASPKYEKPIVDRLTKYEHEIYERYFIYNQKISFIAEETNKSIKQIYNTIYRIRDKYKNNVI